MDESTVRRVATRRRALLDDLRAARPASSGATPPRVPTMRELRARYDLSSATITACLQQLRREGVVVSLPRVGTFYAPERNRADGVYLCVVDDDPHEYAPLPGSAARVRYGFEGRIAGFGAVSLPMSVDEVQRNGVPMALRDLAGVFVWSARPVPRWPWLPDSGVPQVRFAPPVPVPGRSYDRVTMDNVGGARSAVVHLGRHGHSRIAFLGLHRRYGTSARLRWSADRAAGWVEGMSVIGIDADRRLVHLPVDEPASPADELTVGRAVAGHLVAALPASGVTAVLAVNDEVVTGLLAELADSGLSADDWPAIVSFESGRELSRFVTSVRSPYEEMGAAAAELLWERATGRLRGGPVDRTVPMSTIPRLSSAGQWRSRWAPEAGVAGHWARAGVG